MAHKTIYEELCDQYTSAVVAAEDARILQSLMGEQNVTSDAQEAAREEVQSLVYVACKGILCPVCNDGTLVADLAQSQSDDSLAREVLCATCLTRFVEHFALAGLSQVQPGPTHRTSGLVTPLERAVAKIRLKYPATQLLPLFQDFICSGQGDTPTIQLHQQLARRLQQLHNELGCVAECLLQELFPATYDWHRTILIDVRKHVEQQSELLINSRCMFDVDIAEEGMGAPYADLQVSYRHTLSPERAAGFEAAMQQDTEATT